MRKVIQEVLWYQVDCSDVDQPYARRHLPIADGKYCLLKVDDFNQAVNCDNGT